MYSSHRVQTVIIQCVLSLPYISARQPVYVFIELWYRFICTNFR